MKCYICGQDSVAQLGKKLVCLEHYAKLKDISADDAILELRAVGLPDQSHYSPSYGDGLGQTTDAAFYGT